MEAVKTVLKLPTMVEAELLLSLLEQRKLALKSLLSPCIFKLYLMQEWEE